MMDELNQSELTAYKKQCILHRDSYVFIGLFCLQTISLLPLEISCLAPILQYALPQFTLQTPDSPYQGLQYP